MIRLVFLIIGFLALVGLVWYIGPSQIFLAVEQLSSLAIFVIFLTMVPVYGLEAYGWQLTLGSLTTRVGFLRLFAVRMAGEAINMTTPTGYVGGEPMKAYLLQQYGVDLVDGLASVVTAKTTLVLAQILFMLMGMGLTVWILGSSDYNLLAALVSVGMLALGLFLLFAVQRYGIGAGLLRLLRAIKIRLAFLEAREAKLLELDETIQKFYRERHATFLFAVGVFFLGWLAEALEVYAILYFLDVQVDLLSSLAIAALAVLIKGSVFFIPGSLGAQEGGYLLLLLAFGYDNVTGMTFALLRRLREIIWIVVGLVFLALLKDKKKLPPADTPMPVHAE